MTTIDRPPRIQPELPAAEIDIPSPPDQQPDRRAQLIQIGLPLITIIGYVLISSMGGVGRSPLLMVPMALSVLASAGFAFYNHRRERQLQAARAKAYVARLTDMHRDMQVAHDQQRRFYTYNYPAIEELPRLVKASRDLTKTKPSLRSEARLWERRTSDDDFGMVRLGMGTLPSTVVYKLSKDISADDPQARAAVKLAESSRYVDDIPVVIALRQPPERDDDAARVQTSVTHALALAGDSAAVYAAARAMLGHLVVFHAPADLQLQVLASDEQPWKWAEKLPHCSGDEHHKPLCFVNQMQPPASDDGIFGDDIGTEYEQFLEQLRRQLAQRQLRLQKREGEESDASVTLPHLVLVVDLLEAAYNADSVLNKVETEAGISILIEQGLQLGASVIFLVPDRSKVPSGCSAVVEIEAGANSTYFFRYAEVGINSPRFVGVADVLPQLHSINELAAQLEPLRLRQTSGAGLATTVPFLDLMGCDTLSALRQEAMQRWNLSKTAKNAGWLRVPIGKMSGDKVRTLVFSSKHDGVHGMIAGSTGSGKSELLISMICGLAVTYEPSVLNFVLVDYKGGGTFEAFKDLPHCVDIITNLNDSISRMFMAITAELERRQRLLLDAKVNSIVEYRRRGLHERGEGSALPFLFIVIDEFAEMIADRAEYRAQLEKITRIGRSLGVSLILAAQQPSGISDQMRSNIKFRICLRVESPGQSREMLNRTDAAYLPPGIPGRGYLQVGNEDIDLVQMAYAGGVSREQQQRAELPVIWPKRNGGNAELDTEPRELYREIIDQLRSLAKDLQVKSQRAPWPAPLPNRLGLVQPLYYQNNVEPAKNDPLPVSRVDYIDEEDIEAITLGKSNANEVTLNNAMQLWLNDLSAWSGPLASPYLLRAIIGLIDDPASALHRPLAVDLTRGHAVVFGASGTGKTSFLRTVVLSLVATHTPDQLHCYIVELGGRNLKPLEGLPHVGDVISPSESGFEERVEHLLRVLSEKIEERKQIFSEAICGNWQAYQQGQPAKPMPAIVVLIDNIIEFIETFSDPGDAEESLLNRLIVIARQSLSFGIHMLVSASKFSDLPGNLLNVCSERFTLKLLEPNEYRLIVGGQVEDLGDLPGRGYTRLNQAPLSFQVALPFTRNGAVASNPDADQQTLQQLIERMDSERGPRWASGNLFVVPEPIRSLPQKLLLRQMVLPKVASDSYTELANGLNELIRQHWEASRDPNRAASLRALIGRTPGDRDRWLQFDAKHDGVHGMVAGGTGAGKSELLMTLIMHLAMSYDPSVLNFVLVDFKGGGAFKPFEDLPHCVDLLTNLNAAAVRRMFTAINAELDRRQQINAERKVSDLVELRKKFPNDPKLYPHLFIIIDEFAEMIESNPEFRADLDRITRVGRSVGVNLLLASQRPTGVTDQMRANIKLRICLRVENADISREVLRRSDAAFLPNNTPGRGYVQVGNDAIGLIQVAFAGDEISHPDGNVKFFELAVKQICDLHQKQGGTRPSAPWPPSLSAVPTFADLVPKRYLSEVDRSLLTLNEQGELRINPFVANWSGWPKLDWRQFGLRAVVGLVDDPYRAQYRPLTVELSRGHAVVFGAAGWGKSSFMRAMVVSLAATHSPSDLHVYALDLGSRGLSALAPLPHVGTIITPEDRGYEERVQQLWRELEQQIARRRALFTEANVTTFAEYKTLPQQQALPAILLLIDNMTEFLETFASLRQQNEDDNRFKDLMQLARQGLNYGIHLVISADRPNALPSKFYTLFGERFTLRLSDPTDYAAVVGAQIDPIDNLIGRGATKVEQMALHFQVALMPGTVENGSYKGGELALIRQLGDKMQPHAQQHEQPLRINVLPPTVAFDQLLAKHFGLPKTSSFEQLHAAVEQWWAESRDPANAAWLQVPIGEVAGGKVRELRLEAIHDGVHGMIAGGTGSGKSELLMTLIVGLALRYDPSVLNFVLVDYKGGGAFKPFETLPHCVDVVTNLDKTGVDRMFTAINAEVRRRQQLNVETDTKDIVEYRKKGYHLSKGAYPHLFIIIDEYAEMIDDNPDYRAALESITRVGRSVGLNLVLASQRPKGVSDQMRANIKLRLCLRVEDADTSRELLRRPDAALLPSGQPGRGYLQVGGDTIELIQVGFAGVETDQINAKGENVRFFEAAVALASSLNKGAMAARPWPAFLPQELSLESPVFDKEHKPFVLLPQLQNWKAGDATGWQQFQWDTALKPVVGLLDDPAEAKQEPLTLNLRQHHVAIFGDSGSGKTVLLRSLLLSLVATHPPDALHLYVLDFGGSSFLSFANVPHMGALLSSTEQTFDERMQRVFARLERQVDLYQQRITEAGATDLDSYNKRFPDQALPLTVVVIDNFAEFRERYETLLEQTLLPLVRRALSVGITFVVAANITGNIPGKLYALFSGRLTLRQVNTDAYADIVGSGAIEFAELPGRGYIRREGRPMLIQIAQPLDEFMTNQASSSDSDPMKPVLGPMEQQPVPRHKLPEPVHILETIVPLNEVLANPPLPGLVAQIGKRSDLKTATINLPHLGPHLMIAGPSFSGKTSVLYTLLFALTMHYSPEQLGVVLLDTRETLFNYRGQRSLSELPHVLAAESETAGIMQVVEHLEREGAALKQGTSKRSVLVLIDNFDEFSEERELNDCVSRLASVARRYGREGIHIVLAGMFDGNVSNDLRKRVQSSGYGIGLRTVQGLEPFRITKIPSSLQGQELTVGRGYMVRAGQLTQVQVASPYHQQAGVVDELTEETRIARLDWWVSQIVDRHQTQRAAWSEPSAQPATAAVPESAAVQHLRRIARMALAYEQTQQREPSNPALRSNLAAAGEGQFDEPQLQAILREMLNQIYQDQGQHSFISMFSDQEFIHVLRVLEVQLKDFAVEPAPQTS